MAERRNGGRTATEWWKLGTRHRIPISCCPNAVRLSVVFSEGSHSYKFLAMMICEDLEDRTMPPALPHGRSGSCTRRPASVVGTHRRSSSGSSWIHWRRHLTLVFQEYKERMHLAAERCTISSFLESYLVWGYHAHIPFRSVRGRCMPASYSPLVLFWDCV